MDVAQRRYNILNEFAPQLEVTTWKWKLWVGFLIAVILYGGYALYVQITEGHIVTGMRDNAIWGIYIANFIFFLGIGYAGAVISALLRLLRVEWRTPIMRIPELLTIIAMIIGPSFILFCIGRMDRLDHIFLYPRLQSPIIWDVLAISTFIVGGIIFLYLALIRDFALYRDYKLKVSAWRQKLYKMLSLGYQHTPMQSKKLDFSLDIISFILIPIVIIIASIVSWIFGMTLRPGWHSSIFGPYFVMAAIYSGTGVIIIVMWIYRKVYNLEKYITDQHFIYLGFMLIAFAAGYGYFTFSEHFTDWYTSETWNAMLLKKLFDLDQYGYWFYFANFAGILLPVIVIGIPWFRSANSIAAMAVIIVFAMWVKRYLIVVPTLETTLLPMQELRPEYIKYSATWVEWALTFAGVATLALLFTLASKFVTIVPVWENAEAKETNVGPSDKKAVPKGNRGRYVENDLQQAMGKL